MTRTVVVMIVIIRIMKSSNNDTYGEFRCNLRTAAFTLVGFQGSETWEHGWKILGYTMNSSY